MSIARKWIVAHRGDAAVGSENTLAAFQGAISAGADMIELDVQRLADDVLVVFHDATIRGEALQEIGSTRLHEHALNLRLDIPTLAQALDFCAGRIRLDVELKMAHVEDVLRAISNARLSVDDYILTSFDPTVLFEIRKAYPGIQTGILTDGTDAETARKILDRVGADLWAPDYKSVDAAALERCAQLSIALLPWTVNLDPDLKRLLSATSVAGVITDRTRRALELRQTLRQELRTRSTSQSGLTAKED